MTDGQDGIRWGETVDSGCATFSTDDGAIGFVCRVGTNDAEVMLRRLMRLSTEGSQP